MLVLEVLVVVEVLALLVLVVLPMGEAVTVEAVYRVQFQGLLRIMRVAVVVKQLVHLIAVEMVAQVLEVMVTAVIMVHLMVLQILEEVLAAVEQTEVQELLLFPTQIHTETSQQFQAV